MFLTDFLFRTFWFLYALSPVWVPFLLLLVFADIWLRYKKTEAILKQGSVLLEIKLPKEINKSPLAMEIIFTSLFQEGKTEILQPYLIGKIRPWFSFELVSIGGEVKFFVWTPTKFRRLIESQFYAQYPGVEIYEAEDYTKGFFHDPLNLPFWGTTFRFTKDDVYPIKTYVDYGLDKDPKEEFKIDPMTSVLEFLGTMRKGEQIWIQIIIQAHRKDTFKDDARVTTKDDWLVAGQEEIQKKIDEIRAGEIPRQPTEGEKELIGALQRSLSKFPFECTVRGLYMAEKSVFDAIGITGLIGSFRQYSSQTLNGFRLGKFTDFDYPWQDFRRMRRNARERNFLNAYKLRSYFQPPYKHFLSKPFILNTEELATIFHLPGQVAATPTLTKTVSKKSEAPSNLPI